MSLNFLDVARLVTEHESPLTHMEIEAVKNPAETILGIIADESKSAQQRFDEAELYVTQLPQIDFPTFHHFCDGQYIREGFYPRGTVIVGVEWVDRYPMFIMRGKLALIWLESGKILYRIVEAPTYTVTQSNTKRIGMFIEDTSAIMVLRTDETTPDGVMKSKAVSARNNPLLPVDFIPAWVKANQGEILV